MTNDVFPALLHTTGSLPSLTHLSISGRCFLKPELALTDVLAIVDGLPLVALSLGPYLSIKMGETNFQSTISQFPHLESLSAPGEFIVLLMQPPGSLPVLQKLTVVSQAAWGSPLDLTNLSCIVEKFQRHRDLPLLSLDVSVFKGDLVDDVLQGDGSQCEIISKLKAVKRLTLRSPDDAHMCSRTLSKWLGCFPNLHDISWEARNDWCFKPMLLGAYEERPSLQKLKLVVLQDDIY
jgi:hypothetical protein